MTQERLEVRANIMFCMNLGKSVTETCTMLQEAKGKDSVCRALVFRCTKRFLRYIQHLMKSIGLAEISP
jgi:hypothetical protein